MKLFDATLDKTVKPEDVRIRLLVLSFATIAVFIVLVSRLWFLQVMSGQKYMELAEGNYIREIPVEAPRGIIYDRNNKVLVNNRPSISVSLSPQIAEKNPSIVKELAILLEISVKDIQEKLTEKKSDPLKPRIIARDIDDKTLAYIEEHKADLPGVDVVTESIRNYPNGVLGAHIFGYLGEISDKEMVDLKDSGHYSLGDIVGKTGIESVYEGILRGQKGSEKLEVNASGKPLSMIRREEPIAGHNLTLTIDLVVQQAAEQALKDAIARARKSKGSEQKANGGATVVLDPRNGEVLAMASYPTYNPELFIGGISKNNWKNLISKKNNFPLNNRALMSYPPGSTFKPVVLIGALGDGLAKVNDTFNCSGRWYGLGKRWARFCWDHGGHGAIGLTRGIAESCDSVFYALGHKFYKQTKEGLQRWSRVSGFGAKTGIDLPTESKGRIPDKEWKREFNKNNPDYQAWFPGDTVNMAIGQGDVLATPLQLASFYGGLASGGMMYRPHIGKEMVSWDGNAKREFKLKESDKKKLQVSENIVRFTQQALIKVTDPGGTAAAAFAGFPVKTAGKTGTAQVRGKDDFAWYVGYAPIDEPRYVVVVMVEQGGHGGSVAAPAARKILAAAMRIVDKEIGTINDASR